MILKEIPRFARNDKGCHSERNEESLLFPVVFSQHFWWERLSNCSFKCIVGVLPMMHLILSQPRNPCRVLNIFLTPAQGTIDAGGSFNYATTRLYAN